MLRSYLFATADNESQISAALASDADAIVLDLESVSFDRKSRAREMVREVLQRHPAWVRINLPWSDLADIDLHTVAEYARGICVPRTENAADVEWVALRAPDVRLACMIESAAGVLNAPEIAAQRAVTQLVFMEGALCHDIGVEPSREAGWVARSRVVYSSAAAKIAPPVDGPHRPPEDDAGLRAEAEFARTLGFYGKAAIEPRQIPIINEIFMPSREQIQWARSVLEAFESAGAAQDHLELPIAERARAILSLVDR